MKKSGEVAQKLKQTKFRHIKRELEKLLSTSYRNCRFNYFLTPEGENKNRLLSFLGGGVYTCRCPDLSQRLCDARLEDEDSAKTCKYFALRHDKESLKESLKEFFEERTIAEIAIRFPDAASLLWVLSEEYDNASGD